MFWKRKGTDDDRESAPAVDELAAVRIFTSQSVIDGWVDLAGQRLSDVLNVEELLSIASVANHPAADQWTAMERAELLLVVPPPHLADRRVRTHRVKRRILVHSGHYVVRGLVHLVAGIDLDPFLARSRQHFLPVTEAWVTSTAWPELEQQHHALLVNVRNTEQPLKLEVLE